ncbi:Gfo/Idh/MocA family protein [Nocardioides sp. P5_C9_2]
MSLPIALVGCGSMGLNHARVIATGPATDLVLIIDPDEEKGRRAADLFDARWAPGVEDLGGVEAAVVAAPTEHHLAAALPIIEAGLPLLIEKPVCPSVRDTETVVAAAEQAGVPLMCGLLERFNPAVRTAFSMLEEPLLVRSERHSPYAPRIKTGVAWDLLVHDVDLVIQAFGGTHPVRVDVARGHFHPSSLPEAEDVVEASLHFDRGGIASVSASRIGQRKVRSMVISELDRMIEVDLLRRDVTIYHHTTVDPDARGTGYRQSTEIEVPEIIGAEPLVSQLAHFVELVEGRGDVERERASILPAHRVIEQALSVAG